MTTFADNLDGTAGDLLSARSGWTRTGSTDNCILADTGTGFCQTQGTGGSGTWHSPDSGNQPTGNDQYAEAYLSEWGNNAYQLGVRCDTTAAGGNAYLVRRDGVTRTRLYKRISGAFTLLGTYNTGAGSDYTTNKVRLEVTGTSLSVYVGATLAIGPVTDTAIASGSVSTLSRAGTAVTTTANLDDWDAGDLGAGAQTLTLPQIASGEVLYAPTIAPGAVSLTLPVIASTAALYAPSVSLGSVSITLPVIGSAATLYAPTVTVGAVSITLPQIASTTALYAPSVVPDGGPQTLTLPQIASTVFYSPSVVPGAVSITLPLLASGAVLYAPTVSGVVSVTLPQIASTATLYAPSVTTGAVSVTLPLLSNVVQLFPPSVNTGGADEQYPLAGLSLSYPLEGQTQTYPLMGMAA